MVISGVSPRARDSNADRYQYHNHFHSVSNARHFSSFAFNGLHGIWRTGRRLVHGKSFPMTNSILRTAFDNVAGHFSNLEAMMDLIKEIEAKDKSIESIIKTLEGKSKDAEITLKTDIRILINECRHLKSRMTSK